MKTNFGRKNWMFPIPVLLIGAYRWQARRREDEADMLRPVRPRLSHRRRCRRHRILRREVAAFMTPNELFDLPALIKRRYNETL